jgi:hypothetical protein
VVPALSVVLGWQVEGSGVGGSGGVECKALGGECVVVMNLWFLCWYTCADLMVK